MSDAKTAEQAPIEQTPRPIPEVVQKQYDHLVETIRAYNPGADFAQIDAAFRYAAAHHGTQKRKDGSPFITHPLAVAQIVAEELHLDSESIAAALLHDIGIHEAERRHGSSAGPYQEQEGPAVARPLLSAAGADESEIERIGWLIAHHHSCQAGEDTDFRILLEADFLVNAEEDSLPRASIASARERLFRTDSGKKLLDDIFLSEPYII